MLWNPRIFDPLKAKPLKLMRTLIIALLTLSSLNLCAQFNMCDKGNIFTIDQPHLKKYYDDKIPVPKVWPEWPKGADSLQAFFDKHLHFHVTKNQPIQRVFLEFVVDCNGVPGDFRIGNKEKWPIEDEIMKVAKEHMEAWIPAVHKKGANVDCRQIILFSIANSKVRVKYFDQD